MSTLYFQTDCRNGSDGIHGQHGGPPTSSDTGRNGVNGQNASCPEEGGSADSAPLELVLRYSLMDETCRIRADGGDGSKFNSGCEYTTKLEDCPTVVVTAIGGRGGNGGSGGNGQDGSKGRRGKNASRYSSGGNGQSGGDGGSGGEGSGGADGGSGGNIHIILPEEDRFLLMAIQGAENPSPLVEGGAGGNAGVHGIGGSRGIGGKGGKSYTYTDSDDNRTTNSGGATGCDGRSGATPSYQLYPGKCGSSGAFLIRLEHGGALSGTYTHRYDFNLTSHILDSVGIIKPSCFQFGDTGYIRQIEARNCGGMKSPPEKVIFSILNQGEYLVPSIPMGDDVQLPNGCATDVNERQMAAGELEYFVAIPEVTPEHGDDFEPIVRHMDLRLRATQVGPELHGLDSTFYRDYDSFDTTGTPISLRFPVENTLGFEGISSLSCGESMRVALQLSNISPRDIGALTKDGRRLLIQFYTNHQHSDCASAVLSLCMNGEQCLDLDRANADPNALWKGHTLSINHINANSSQNVEGVLCLSNQIPPYARIVLQAEILLENQKLCLGHSDYKFGSLKDVDISLIQRRKLEIVCEPSCFFTHDSHVVIVTTLATTQTQYLTWTRFISESLGLKVDTYSVSLYGSLTPDFVIGTSTDVTLHQNFDGKLIIVLDETFNPLDKEVSAMTPSQMLPNGCMEQLSGFSPSTRWLFVNSDPESVTGLLMSQYTAPPNDIGNHPTKPAFREVMLSRLALERSSGTVQDGMIREDVIIIPTTKASSARQRAKIIKKKAESTAKWLRKNDSLRQHVVKWELSENAGEIGKLFVRRGFCSTMNSAFFVAADKPYTVQEGALNNSIKFSVAQSLPQEYGIEAFYNAIKSEDKEICSYFKDAFTSKFLFEIDNYLEGKFLKNASPKDSFSSISSMINAPLLDILIKEKGSTPFVQEELSDLVSRFYCVANSKDLQPLLLPFSRKIKLKNHLVQRVKDLEKKWSEALDKNTIKANIAIIEKQVLFYIKSTRGKYNCRTNKRWRKGLRWKFSHQSPLYSTSEVAPFIELDQLHNNKVSRNTGVSNKPATRKAVTRVFNSAACTIFSQGAQLRIAMSEKLVKSIESTRAEEIISNQEPEIDLS